MMNTNGFASKVGKMAKVSLSYNAGAAPAACVRVQRPKGWAVRKVHHLFHARRESRRLWCHLTDKSWKNILQALQCKGNWNCRPTRTCFPQGSSIWYKNAARRIFAVGYLSGLGLPADKDVMCCNWVSLMLLIVCDLTYIEKENEPFFVHRRMLTELLLLLCCSSVRESKTFPLRFHILRTLKAAFSLPCCSLGVFLGHTLYCL